MGRWFLASVFLTAPERDPTFRRIKLSKSCSISRNTTMTSLCATAVPSFGSQATTMDGPVTWYKKLASPPGALSEVRHPRQPLRLVALHLLAPRAQARLPELQLRPPSLQPRALAAPALPNQPLPSRRHLRLALQLTTQRASARLMGLHLRPLPLLPNALAVPRPPSRLHQTTVLPFRRIDYLRAAGRLQMRSVRSAGAGTTPGGRATLTCATAVVTRCPPPLLSLSLLQRRSAPRRRRTQTARHVPIPAPQPIRAQTDCVAASGGTVDQQLDTVEIAARGQTVGPREKNQVILDY